MAGIE